MRASRTFSTPFPMKYAQPGGTYAQHLPQRPQRPRIRDSRTHSECRHPEADRPDRTVQALSNPFDWFVPSQVQQPVVIRRCPWSGGWPPGCDSFPRLLCLGGVALLKSRPFGGPPQLLDALPAVSTRPLRDKLQDSVDCITLFGRPEFDPSDQQLINGCQLFAGLITLLSRSPGHCATSLQEDPKVMSSHRATRWSSPAATFTHEQSRAKLAAFINAVPRSWSRTYFLWTKERLTLSMAETKSGPHFQRSIADAARGRLADALRSGDARSLLVPHIY